MCLPCMSCDPSATIEGECLVGSVNDVMCTCNAGFFGNGRICNRCKTCAQQATESGQPCSAGSTADTLLCTCNAGYYGAGTICTPCQACDVNATTPWTCPPGTVSYYTCSCNTGYFGNGTTCTPCPAGTYTSKPGALAF